MMEVCRRFRGNGSTHVTQDVDRHVRLPEGTLFTQCGSTTSPRSVSRRAVRRIRPLFTCELSSPRKTSNSASLRSTYWSASASSLVDLACASVATSPARCRAATSISLASISCSRSARAPARMCSACSRASARTASRSDNSVWHLEVGWQRLTASLQDVEHLGALDQAGPRHGHRLSRCERSP